MISIALQLDWKPNAQFAGILWAHRQGWFEQAGIDVQIRPWQPFADPVAALADSGNVIVSTEDNLLIRGVDRGMPIKAIGSMMQYSGLGWITLKSSGIHTLSDLKGKRIGIHGDGETGLKISLAQVGLSPDDVEIIEIGYDYAQLLQSGEFAAVQCLVMVEPLELAYEGLELQIIPAYEWGYQVYSQVIATTDRLLQSDPEAVTQFLKVTFDGWRYAFSHSQEVSQVVVDSYLHESNAEVQESLLLALRPLFETELGLDNLGWMTADRWEKSIGYLKTYGLIQNSLTPKEVMTNELMQAVYS